ncbi:unnamed protein product [Oikopleura dioica]|uniref:EGF-like domain-containing protein n=1 Tax=Oikopleura dioica TaxID=34765 RepID=E4YBS3_OIKDI|nr:unnamed protein product [Oikopleura dioica]
MALLSSERAVSELILSSVCLCASAFDGLRCELAIDSCDSASCQNNATCIDTSPGWECKCPPG